MGQRRLEVAVELVDHWLQCRVGVAAAQSDRADAILASLPQSAADEPTAACASEPVVIGQSDPGDVRPGCGSTSQASRPLPTACARRDRDE